MKSNQKGYTSIAAIFLIFWLFVIVSWVKNVYELTQCDFDPNSSYKCEVIHTAGLIPVISLVTAWIDLGK